MAMVNATLAQRLFPGTDPIGKRFTFGNEPGRATWVTIVGVLADTKMYGSVATSNLPVGDGPARAVAVDLRRQARTRC